MENIVVLGDFNTEPTNQEMTTFMSGNDFINIIKSNTCFKISTGICIDLILTNKLKSFRNTGVIKTGVSNHHLLIFLFLKTPSQKCHQINYVIVSINCLIKCFWRMSQTYLEKQITQNGKISFSECWINTLHWNKK